MEDIKYVNLIEISSVVTEIWGVENGDLAVPVNNILVCCTSFLAADTRPCVLIIISRCACSNTLSKSVVSPVAQSCLLIELGKPASSWCSSSYLVSCQSFKIQWYHCTQELLKFMQKTDSGSPCLYFLLWKSSSEMSSIGIILLHRSFFAVLYSPCSSWLNSNQVAITSLSNKVGKYILEHSISLNYSCEYIITTMNVCWRLSFLHS